MKKVKLMNELRKYCLLFLLLLLSQNMFSQDRIAVINKNEIYHDFFEKAYIDSIENELKESLIAVSYTHLTLPTNREV